MSNEMSAATRNKVVQIAAESGFHVVEKDTGEERYKKNMLFSHLPSGKPIYINKVRGQKQDGSFTGVRVAVKPENFLEIDSANSDGIRIAINRKTKTTEFLSSNWKAFDPDAPGSVLGKCYDVDGLPALRKLLVLIDARLCELKFTVEQAASNGSTVALRPQEGSKAPIAVQRRKLTLRELEEQLARQREIGTLGEDCAFRYESDRLSMRGCSNPGAHIERLTDDDVGAGYDIRSIYEGKTRCIEVKGSVRSIDSFFLSENERKTLAQLGTDAYIYMVLVDEANAKNTKVICEIPDPMGEGKLELEPVAYRATLCADAMSL